ncbi:hypothetical protein FRB96_004610, partial [Tulasnella sp. 330]
IPFSTSHGADQSLKAAIGLRSCKRRVAEDCLDLVTTATSKASVAIGGVEYRTGRTLGAQSHLYPHQN